MTDFFVKLAERAGEAGLNFLLVGGHAVVAHGHLRTTLDADLLIPEEEAAAWRALWEKRGYRCVHASEAFIQFESADQEERYPVDLMLVSAETFARLRAHHVVKDVGGAALPLPAPLHLIALKLHALKAPGRSEQAPDLDDIVGLVRSCHIDPKGVAFENVIQRYADESLARELARRLA